MTDHQTIAPRDNAPRQVRLVPSQSLPANESYGDYGYSASGVSAEESSVVTMLREYLRILNKRKWIVLGIVIAFVSLSAIRTLMMTPLYVASVRVQIERNVAKIVEGGSITPTEGGGYESDFMRTQFELFQSRTMAERVVIALRLGDDQEFLYPKKFSLLGFMSGLLSSKTSDVKTISRAERERAATAVVLANRAVRPVPGSRLVDVTYWDSDPVRAQRIVTALADAYIASNLDKRFQANAYAKAFLDDQLKHLKLRLEQSEKQLLDFAQKEQIVDVTEKTSIAENNLAGANATLGQLVSERIKNEQLWKQVASADSISLPQVLNSSVIGGLRDQRNRLVTEYQEKLEIFKPSYPAMVQIDNKIKEVDRQLAFEVRTIKDSLHAGYEASRRQEEEMKNQIERLRSEVLDLQKRSIQYNILKREVETNRSLYEGLLQRQKQVDVAGGVGANNVFVVDRAEVPGSPSSPNLSRSLFWALLLGIGVGVGSAFLLEQFDDTIRSTDELERATGLTTLGVIPKTLANQRLEDELADPRSSFAEAYRSLCTALQFTTDSGLPRSLYITSAGPSEGKSITSLAISRHFAMMGMKVLVVDADMRNPSLHKKLGCDNAIGLSNYLTGACTPPEAFKHVGIPNLAFMASGPLPPNAADLLSNARLHSLVSVGLEVFDLIVIDGPPVMGIADAALLANATAGTLFVVSANQARLSLVRGSLRRLQFGRASILGAVLTKYDAKAAGYGYGSDYGYGYGANNDSQRSVPENSAQHRLTG